MSKRGCQHKAAVRIAISNAPCRGDVFWCRKCGATKVVDYFNGAFHRPDREPTRYACWVNIDPPKAAKKP